MATVVEPTVREDTVEGALAILDADYHHIFGPDMARWSKGVRGELIEMSRTCQASTYEAQPLHPRRASAGRRRRHRTQLGYRGSRIAPGAVTVLLAPVWTDASGPMERVFIAQCMNAEGQRLKLPSGGSRHLATLMQGVFPAADWNQAQSWRADTNQLTSWRQRQAAS